MCSTSETSGDLLVLFLDSVKLPLVEPYIIVLISTGLLIGLVVWLPLALKRLPLSLPIVCVAIGAATFTIPQIWLVPIPVRYPQITERFTEFVLITALMGAGLKIDTIVGRKRWAVTWRLLGLTMPLGIVTLTALAMWALNFSLAAALLLAACLAPTDPVLAADVQVGPPGTGEEDEVRFGLTSEAGLNDSAAFPFVHLAILVATVDSPGAMDITKWFSVQVVWAIAVGVLGGWGIGQLFGWLTFRASIGKQLSRTGDGLVALSATLVAYGLTETVHAYGFVAVFVTALKIRHANRGHVFQSNMHTVMEQVERLVMMAFLILFGGSLTSGLLSETTWIDVLFAAAVIVLIRPMTGWIGLMRFPVDSGEKLMLAFFGIRGVGSVYYLAYALNHALFPDAERLWSIVGMVILFSVFVHGLTATALMRLLDRQQGRLTQLD